MHWVVEGWQQLQQFFYPASVINCTRVHLYQILGITLKVIPPTQGASSGSKYINIVSAG